MARWDWIQRDPSPTRPSAQLLQPILPGLMHLLGDHAWSLPGWLDRLIPNVDVEGAALERKHPQVAGAPLEEPYGDAAPGWPAAVMVD